MNTLFLKVTYECKDDNDEDESDHDNVVIYLIFLERATKLVQYPP